MLVLGRKLNQEILIGDNIKVVILDMTRTTVKIGIVAPQDVRVLRTEIVNRPAKNKETSTEVDQPNVAAPSVAKVGRDHTALRAVSPFDAGSDKSATMSSVDSSAAGTPTTRVGSMADRVRQLRSATSVRINPRLSAAV